MGLFISLKLYGRGACRKADQPATLSSPAVKGKRTQKDRATQVTRSFSMCNSISLSKSEEIVPVVKVEPKVFEQIVKI